MSDAMVSMSRAIRHTLEDFSTGPSMRELPEDVLIEFVQIVGAFYADLRDEAKRRGLVS